MHLGPILTCITLISAKDLWVGAGGLRCILVSAGGCSEDQCHACLFSPRTSRALIALRAQQRCPPRNTTCKYTRGGKNTAVQKRIAVPMESCLVPSALHAQAALPIRALRVRFNRFRVRPTRMQRATLECILGGSYTGVQFRAGIGRVGVLATLELGACPLLMHCHPITLIIILIIIFVAHTIIIIIIMVLISFCCQDQRLL